MAPRGVPQIEVTFDVDANGIVNVSAKDLGTGKEQKITITASSNLSKDDIEKAVKEAELYAAEDAKRKEEVELRNQADQMVYQSEKMLADVGDKLEEADKTAIQDGMTKVQEALKGEEIELVRLATEALTKALQTASEKLYSQSGHQHGGPEGDFGGQTPPEGDFVDADYEVVDDQEQK